MLKRMKKHLNNEKGLTLIELLAVIVILAIVAAIAVPAIGNLIENSRVKAAKADIANVINASNLYFTENSVASVDKAGLNPYLDSWGILGPDAAGTISVAKAIGNTKTTITVGGVVKIGNRNYTVSPVTLDTLKVEDPSITGVFTLATGQ